MEDFYTMLFAGVALWLLICGNIAFLWYKLKKNEPMIK